MGINWVLQAQEEIMEIAEVLGIYVKDIYFSGFENWEKICFTGSYHFTPNPQLKVRQIENGDLELQSLADRFHAAQKNYNLSCSLVLGSRAFTRNSIEFRWSSPERGGCLTPKEREAARSMNAILRDFMYWMLGRIKSVYEGRCQYAA